MPPRLQRFAARALAAALTRPHAVARALGEVLTEPKPQVWFEAGGALGPGQGVRLDARTRMLVDAHHVFVNGQSWRAAGRDARTLAELAHRRSLGADALAALGRSARGVVQEWVQDGWAHAVGPPADAGSSRGTRASR